jgi:hypothetical protein
MVLFNKTKKLEAERQERQKLENVLADRRLREQLQR